MPDITQILDIGSYSEELGYSLFGYVIVLCFVFISMGISLWSLHLSHRNTIATSISNNRINWIGTVRRLIIRFLTEYGGERDCKKLKRLYTEIALYCNPRHKIYANLIYTMQKCMLSECYVDAYYWEILSEAQRVLDSSWVRMKREAGISRKEELKMANMFSSKFEDVYKTEWTAEIRTPPHRRKCRKRAVHKLR